MALEEEGKVKEITSSVATDSPKGITFPSRRGQTSPILDGAISPGKVSPMDGWGLQRTAPQCALDSDLAVTETGAQQSSPAGWPGVVWPSNQADIAERNALAKCLEVTHARLKGKDESLDTLRREKGHLD
jgi:hypothetical protein